jgi:hypothetical protein
MRRSVVLVLLTVVAGTVVAAEDTRGPQPASAQPPPSPEVTPVRVKTRLTTSTPAYSMSYQYDSLGRLITATKDAHASNFTYDAAGNRTVSSEQ